MICSYIFFVITVEAYQNARVHTITVKNKDFF